MNYSVEKGVKELSLHLHSFSQDPKIKKTQHVKKIKIKIDLSFMFKIL